MNGRWVILLEELGTDKNVKIASETLDIVGFPEIAIKNGDESSC